MRVWRHPEPHTERLWAAVSSGRTWSRPREQGRRVPRTNVVDLGAAEPHSIGVECAVTGTDRVVHSRLWGAVGRPPALGTAPLAPTAPGNADRVSPSQQGAAHTATDQTGAAGKLSRGAPVRGTPGTLVTAEVENPSHQPGGPRPPLASQPLPSHARAHPSRADPHLRPSMTMPPVFGLILQ